MKSLPCLASLLFLAHLAFAATAPQELPIKPDAVIATDGSGDFKTIQSALESIPRNNKERRILYIKNGVYHEKIHIDPAFITLTGESRTGARIEFPQGATEFREKKDDLGTAVVNINGDDCVLQNLTIENTHGVIGVHAFAVYGRGDRTVNTDCDVLSQGNDTLSLWLGERGRYYHARLKVRGSVDFICPRGWCYMTDSDIYEVNPKAEAAMWHDGSKNKEMKFVMRDCRFDGVEGWRFARHHHDAQFFFIDCTFADTMRDSKPKRVMYPLNGGTATEADIQRNKAADPTNIWGERFYYFNCHRKGGDYPWYQDNLSTAPNAPKPETITAAWTFEGTWDPERTAEPKVLAVTRNVDQIDLKFSEPVTVKGKPQLKLSGGVLAAYASGSGSDVLTFTPSAASKNELASVDLNGGAIVANEADATIHLAKIALPK